MAQIHGDVEIRNRSELPKTSSHVFIALASFHRPLTSEKEKKNKGNKRRSNKK
ncbi:hypothetical protein Syun_024053 [Stephania yunnanensis]|uniref:Uncharacterized protein n=1 Tax=Stephania yunnanensis TaxID=152371 RepID=A0AAP0I2P0_9MAGN